MTQLGDERQRVLHVPYTYFPDPCGGTEVYVHGLGKGLTDLGYECFVAAPGHDHRSYLYDGIPVHRFPTDRAASFERAYGAPDEFAAEGFRGICAEVRPAVVHLHARTSAVSERFVGIARGAGAKVVLTYHTPTVSCARGTMMLFGKEPCDGVMNIKRCASCALSVHGVPAVVASAAAAMPNWLLSLSTAWAPYLKALKAVHAVSLMGEMHVRLRDLFSKVDHVVAVCQWVKDVLERNGVPPAKITLSRQGIAQSLPRSRSRSPQAGSPLSIAYFGRVDRSKGPDLLVHALQLASDENARVDIFAVRQPGSEPDIAFLEKAAAADRRLRVLPAVPADRVMETMSGYDLVAVPSRWLETGPLVVLEAFAAGVPVMGARLGGIAELVTDGVNGVLVAPDDPKAWADAITDLSRRRDLPRLRREIAVPRTMRDVANDMAAVYSTLLSRRTIDASAAL